MDNNEVMKASAANFGFDAGWVADVLEKFGADVLALAVEAARNGFSVNFIVELLQKFGPSVLQFLVSVFGHHTAAMRMAATDTGVVVTGDVVQGVDTSMLEIIIQQYLPQIIQKFLPTFWDQFGPLVMQFIQNNLQEIFAKFGPQIMQLVKDNLPQIIQLVLQLLKK